MGKYQELLPTGANSMCLERVTLPNLLAISMDMNCGGLKTS